MKRKLNHDSRRMVRAGEMLAIDSRVLIKSSDAFFFMLGPSNPDIKRIGSTAIVYVRGPLEHHADSWGANYERLIEDVKCAWEGDDENEPAKKVVLCIDSPGGVVSGLYDCVAQLKKLANGRPFHAYVEGLCASAAMALACSCSKIFCTSSSIMGSVGVIATMYSQRKRDKAMGIDVVTITSGARKADGHPHVAISDDAIKAETKRVEQFAEAFYDLVEGARGFDPEPDEAGLFVGKDAVKAGYADAIRTIDDLQEKSVDTKVSSDTMQVNSDTISGVKGDTAMRLSKLIEKTKAAIKVAKSGEEKTALRLKLAAYTQTMADTKKTYEKETETEETTGDDDEEEEESSDDGDDDDDDGGGGNDTDRDEESEDEEESEDDHDEEDSESEEDEKKAAASLRLAAKGMKGKAKAAALSALKTLEGSIAARRSELKGSRKLASKIDKLVADNDRRDREAVIGSALAAGRVTPAEAKSLKKQSTDYVAAFLAARPRAIVREGKLAPNLSANIPALANAMGNQAPADLLANANAEITGEMREAAKAIAERSNGKIKVEDVLRDFTGKEAS